jgi:hypothetical protein
VCPKEGDEPPKGGVEPLRQGRKSPKEGGDSPKPSARLPFRFQSGDESSETGGRIGVRERP